MTKTRTAGYVVYQSGFAIFGTGETPDAAEADAQEWTSETIDAAEAGHGETHGEMYYAPATARLLAAVARDGGDIRYAVIAGIADLDDAR